jgi:hypothetical protein
MLLTLLFLDGKFSQAGHMPGKMLSGRSEGRRGRVEVSHQRKRNGTHPIKGRGNRCWAGFRPFWNKQSRQQPLSHASAHALLMNFNTAPQVTIL